MQVEHGIDKQRAHLIVVAYGFRSFFLLAGAWSVVPTAALVWFLASGAWPVGAVTPFSWHGHEMLCGFAAAAISGFLLTAVPTWTGIRAVSGAQLMGLVALWVAGRIASAPWDFVSNGLIRIAGVAFLPAVAISIALPIIRARNYRNLPFLVFLALLFVADLSYLAPRFGWTGAWPFDGLRLALNTVVLMIAIVGGRIVPAFTRNALKQLGTPVSIKSYIALDAGAITAVAGVLVSDLFFSDGLWAGVLAGLAAVLLGARLSFWNGWRTRDVPLLWVLHLGYGWVVFGLALKALWLLGSFAWAANWMHALSVGAFGTMILGVMTRVALGHTGRPLQVSKYVTAAYLLVTAAAVLRVWGPWLAPGHYLQVLAAAVFAWISAFALFLAVYLPILVRPRIDGRPG